MKTPSPLYDAIRRHASKKAVPFHMPVHGSGRLFSAAHRQNLLALDVTELSGTDNLADPQDCIRDTQQAFAKAYNAQISLLLTGGATAGIQAMLFYACRGGKLILDIHAHKSVLSACILYNIHPVFVERTTLEPFGVADGVTHEAVYEAITAHPDAKAIFITTPTFYGITTDLTKIARLAQSAGMLLLADQAHGAHFPFCSVMPPTAGAQGADIWVCSIHKTLGAPTQTAVLNITSDRVDADAVRSAVQLMHTTSPSYVLMAMADLARSTMQYEGEDRLCRVAQYGEAFKKKLTAATKCRCLDAQDPLRLVINFSSYQITGIQISEILLNRYNIEMEMSDRVNIVAICGPCTAKNHLNKLYQAIVEITENLTLAPTPQAFPPLPLPLLSLSPTEAYAGQGEWIGLAQAEGRICANTVSVYPPGVPVLMPGVSITKEQLSYLNLMNSAGAKVLGMEKKQLFILKHS